MFPPPQDWHAAPEIVLRHEGAVHKIHVGCHPCGSRLLHITKDGASVFTAVLPAGAAAVLGGLLAGEAGDAQEARNQAWAVELENADILARAEAERIAALPRAKGED
ncbi:hypothetical protein [Roseococcus microcysteis]|uniref:hypothetical protein n=1 Tax=Roseococcus microcysteis TaxID=2771361 RepID=UPI00168B9355|nr:hypothetical protein [Roseococcus microcysteis]